MLYAVKKSSEVPMAAYIYTIIKLGFFCWFLFSPLEISREDLVAM